MESHDEPNYSLSSILQDESKPLEPRERILIFLKACESLEKIHADGLVNCEINPDNILYDRKTDTVSIVNSGLSKQANSPKPRGERSGEKGYIAPEMEKSYRYLTSFDIFSIARVGRELFYLPTQDELFRRLVVGQSDQNGANGFSDKERNTLEEIFQAMERLPRLPLSVAITEIRKFLKVHDLLNRPRIPISKEQKEAKKKTEFDPSKIRPSQEQKEKEKKKALTHEAKEKSHEKKALNSELQLLRKSINFLNFDTLFKLQKKLKENKYELGNAARLSKRYLKEKLKININRGGIIVTKEDKEEDYSIWAVVKDEEPPGKAVRLGSGGFGKIKIIENVLTGKRKAIKVLVIPEHHAQDPQIAISDFKQEAENLKQLGQNCVYVNKMQINGTVDSKPCFIMDLEPGLSLHEILAASHLSSQDSSDVFKKAQERINLLKKACRHVAYIHLKGLVHCDLKTRNFVYDQPTQEIKAVDFGLAKPINGPKDPGSIGSLGYMSPAMRDSKQYLPSFDVFSMARVAREIFSFPILDKTFEPITIGVTYFKGNEGFTPEEFEWLKNLIKEMETSPEMTIWEAFKKIETFQIQWEASHAQEEKQEDPNEQKKALSDAIAEIKKIHMALEEKKPNIANAIEGFLKLQKLINSNKKLIAKVIDSIPLSERKIFDPTLFQSLCHSAFLLRESSKSSGLDTKLDRHKKEIHEKSNNLLDGIELFSDFTKPPRPKFRSSEFLKENKSDPGITRTMKHMLSSDDRFSCYAADIFNKAEWPTEINSVLNLFENYPLDRFFDKDEAPWDFFSEPFHTAISEGFKSTHRAISQFKESKRDETEIKQLFNTIDQDLAKESDMFWNAVLKENPSSLYSQRVLLIREQLFSAFRAYVISFLANTMSLSQADPLIKKMLELNKNIKDIKVGEQKSFLKQSALEQLANDAAMKLQPRDAIVKSALSEFLNKEYKPRRLKRRDHNTDAGELALLYNIDAKTVSQRNTVKDEKDFAKFNLELCQPFNYQRRIAFIEGKLLKILQNPVPLWGIPEPRIKLIARNLQDQQWEKGNSDDVWAKVHRNFLDKDHHKFFRKLCYILLEEYKHSPNLAQTETSQFVRAMVFKLTNHRPAAEHKQYPKDQYKMTAKDIAELETEFNSSLRNKKESIDESDVLVESKQESDSLGKSKQEPKKHVEQKQFQERLKVSHESLFHGHPIPAALKNKPGAAEPSKYKDLTNEQQHGHVIRTYPNTRKRGS